MIPTIAFKTESGIRRLLSAPGDIAPRGAPVSFASAGPAFQQIYAAYRDVLWDAHLIAVPWWENTINAQEGLGLSRADAVKASFDKRMAGAASHPRVVQVIRDAWLRTAALGRNGPVAPEQLLLQWLIDAGESDLVTLVACMPYWPIGIDDEGNWC